VSDEALALDVIKEVGPGGEFVTHPHTYGHFRDVWYPELLFRGGAEAWAASDQTVYEQRVRRRTQDLMETHEPVPLPEDVSEAIRAIVTRAEEA